MFHCRVEIERNDKCHSLPWSFDRERWSEHESLLAYPNRRRRRNECENFADSIDLLEDLRLNERVSKALDQSECKDHNTISLRCRLNRLSVEEHVRKSVRRSFGSLWTFVRVAIDRLSRKSSTMLIRHQRANVWHEPFESSRCHWNCKWSRYWYQTEQNCTFGSARCATSRWPVRWFHRTNSRWIRMICNERCFLSEGDEMKSIT